MGRVHGVKDPTQVGAEVVGGAAEAVGQVVEAWVLVASACARRVAIEFRMRRALRATRLPALPVGPR